HVPGIGHERKRPGPPAADDFDHGEDQGKGQCEKEYPATTVTVATEPVTMGMVMRVRFMGHCVLPRQVFGQHAEAPAQHHEYRSRSGSCSSLIFLDVLDHIRDDAPHMFIGSPVENLFAATLSAHEASGSQQT